ncbi:hypothetical protein [Ostreibacterium oceani]|uniref:Uncharacterized protein n=1 Tax=Ostreibacterium oceani TaxID=2654998 RepID=A0A6N7EXD2_9GAMM|nr:hypothetical protein [Ostreibacterium oceani]MPV86245.1 hypothetical protein [Ostreibacterium oceani]
MKLEKAYAEDIKSYITAYEADQQFKIGKIKSKFNFKCPGNDCLAPVTCANLDRPDRLRKREPYYKVVGEHSAECDLAKDINIQSHAASMCQDIYGESDPYYKGIRRLDLQLPSTKRLARDDNNDQTMNATETSRHTHETESGKRKNQPRIRLSSLIDTYLNEEFFELQLPAIGVINSRDLFFEINGQDIGGLEDYFRIFYGKAWFNKKEKGYSVVFDKTLTHGETTQRPSTYIPISVIESSPFKHFNLSTMEKIADNRPKDVFVLSETGPRVKNGYINLWCEGIMYIDYRLIKPR